GEAPDPVAASVWGLVRTAQSENPGRILLADLDGSDASRDSLVGALAAGEPQVALRDGAAYAPRVTPAGSGGTLVPPGGERAWHLGVERKGTLDGLALMPSPRAEA